jgi:serine/threonine/tyrosine protein kinase RAD53
MCGTPTYLAPEVVNQREGGGYTNRVDSWSVGVMVFSMYDDDSVIFSFRLFHVLCVRLTNAAPFIEDENQRDIRLRISERKVDWSILTQANVSSRGQ